MIGSYLRRTGVFYNCSINYWHTIFINSLFVLSVVAFVFDSITLWFMFVVKFHRWQERGRRDEKKRKDGERIYSLMIHICTFNVTQDIRYT